MDGSRRWRWVDSPVRGNPDNVRNILVVGDGLLPGPEVILECGNIDATYKDRIAAVPELMEKLGALLSRLPIPDRSMRSEVYRARELLERLKG